MTREQVAALAWGLVIVGGLALAGIGTIALAYCMGAWFL